MAANPWRSLLGSFLSGAPSILTLFVTDRCNARCGICFNWQNTDSAGERGELTLDEIGRIAGSLPRLHSLILSGGEPFLREDLSEIVRLFHEKSGVRHVSIPTNLFLEDAADRINELAAAFPGVFFRILISIDGVGEAHDRLRGVKGGFGRLRANLERLQGRKERLNNLSLNTVVVLSAFNAGDIFSTLDYAGGLGVDDVKVIHVRGNPRDGEALEVPPCLYRRAIAHAERLTARKGRTRSLYNDLFSAVSLTAKEAIADYVETGRAPSGCNAGERLLVISSTGELYPCEILGRKLGDLRQAGFDVGEVLKSPEAREVVRYIRAGNCACTMDCNAISNVVYHPRFYPRVARKFFTMLSRRLKISNAP